jgi:hypothetical protein
MPEHLWEVRTFFSACVIFPASFVIVQPDRLIFWGWEKTKIAREGNFFHASVYLVPYPAFFFAEITKGHTRKPSCSGFTYAGLMFQKADVVPHITHPAKIMADRNFSRPEYLPDSSYVRPESRYKSLTRQIDFVNSPENMPHQPFYKPAR